MKVVNLDKFRNKSIVILDGEQYEVKGLTVNMYLNDSDFAEMNANPEDQKGQIERMLNILTKLSNVPREVLVEQDFAVLSALMLVAQGGNPEEKEESSEQAGDSQAGNE